MTIDDREVAESALNEQLIPRIKEAPGFVAGYWTNKDKAGLGMTVWESEDAAETAAGMVHSMPAEGVTIGEVEVREVVGRA